MVDEHVKKTILFKWEKKNLQNLKQIKNGKDGRKKNEYVRF